MVDGDGYGDGVVVDDGGCGVVECSKGDDGGERWIYRRW